MPSAWPPPSVRRFRPTTTKVLQEYVLDNVFEAVYTAYIGLSAKVPFRVLTLSNPTKIVIDLWHP